MNADPSSFEPQFQRLLSSHQQRAVLAAIGDALPSATTLGEIIDAAGVLGWNDGVHQLRLVDLAQVLLAAPEAGEEPRVGASETAPAPAADAEPESEPAATRPRTKAEAARAKAATRKKSASDAATKAASKPAKKAASKAAKAEAPPPEAFDERMSLDEAIAAFVPLVGSLGEATMQDLEQATGLGRRKLRFHVGQLVKHGHLSRHGMGRGTFYSV